MTEWPTSINFSNGFRDHFAEVADSVFHGDGTYPEEHGFEVYDTGAGRVVYDISDHTSIPAVLRVAYNQTGVEETRKEEGLRSRVPTELRERLVPVLDYGHGHVWSVQPKCESIPYTEKDAYVEELTQIVDNLGTGYDSREVYKPNIGLWNGKAVIFDYGGILVV